MVNGQHSGEGTTLIHKKMAQHLSTRRLEGSDKYLFQEVQLTKTISWESSQVFQPPTFQAPSLSKNTLNGKANRRPKKRSFKARGDHARLDSDFNQMIILNYRILEVSDVSSLNAQYGKVNFPLAFTKQFQDQGVLEPAPIRVHVVWKSDAVDGMSKLLGGFSFMLGAPHNCDWDKVDGHNLVREQISFFAYQLKKETLSKLVLMEWSSTTISCSIKLDKDGIRHLIISWPAYEKKTLGYLCIHVNGVTDVQIQALGHYYWWQVCNARMDSDVDSRESFKQKASKHVVNVGAVEAPIEKV